MTAVTHKVEEAGDSACAPVVRRENTHGQNASKNSRAEARERRDIVSGAVMPDSRLIRFVADPNGNVVPDVAAKLPGRGLWVEASRDAVNRAVEKKLFSRAARRPASGGESAVPASKGEPTVPASGGGPIVRVTAAADLAARAEKALVARILGDIGIARRSGALVLGFDNVLRALEGPKPPKVVIEALDGSPDGKRKLYAAAHRLDLHCVVIETLTSAELGLALGRENVIHAAVQPGGLADRLTFDAERLSGFRPSTRPGTERDL